MLNDILDLLIKLLREGAGPRLREGLAAAAAGGELPYGAALAELVKQQNLISENDIEKILALVMALLGVETGEKKASCAQCESCPYAPAGTKEQPRLALPEKTPMEFDIDRAASVKPLSHMPDAAALAEDALQARIRALSGLAG